MRTLYIIIAAVTTLCVVMYNTADITSFSRAPNINIGEQKDIYPASWIVVKD